MNKIKNLCYECNEFVNKYNDFFKPEPFIFYHAKVKDCREDYIGLDGNKISCLMIYAHTLRNFAYPATLPIEVFEKCHGK